MKSTVNKLCMRLLGIRLPPNITGDSISENLMYLLSPTESGRQGIKGAFKICSCTEKVLNKTWDSGRLEIFKEELKNFSKVKADETPTNKETLKKLLKEGPAMPSDFLNAELKEVAQHISYCEEKCGAMVEF